MNPNDYVFVKSDSEKMSRLGEQTTTWMGILTPINYFVRMTMVAIAGSALTASIALAQSPTSGSTASAPTNPLPAAAIYAGAFVVELGIFYGVAVALSGLMSERQFPPKAARRATLLAGVLLAIVLVITVILLEPLLRVQDKVTTPAEPVTKKAQSPKTSSQ
jgi:hypothetical protein